MGALNRTFDPIRQAMAVQAGVQNIFAKGLFDQRPFMTPLDQEFAKENIASQAMRIGKEVPGFDTLDVLDLQTTAITQGRQYSNNPEKNQITDQFLKSILNFALIDKMKPDEAFNVLESLRKSYDLPDSATGILGDKLAYTSVKTGANTQEIGDSLSRVQGLGFNIKVPIDALLSLQGVLADFGNIKGRESGTQMLNIMTALLAPDNETAKELKLLGFSVKDEKTGGMKPMSEIFKDLGTITKGWDDTNQGRLFKGVGNQEGINSLMTFVRMAKTDEGMARLKLIENETALDEKDPTRKGGIKGTVEDIGGSLQQGLSPALDELRASISNLMVAMGMPNVKSFEDIVRKIGAGVDRLTAFFQANPLAGKAVIWGGLAIAVGLFAPAIGLVIVGLILLWPLIKAGIVIGSMVVAAIYLIAYAFIKLWGVITSFGDLIKAQFNFIIALAKELGEIFENLFSGKFWSTLFGGEDTTITVRKDQGPQVTQGGGSNLKTLSDEEFKRYFFEDRAARDREARGGNLGRLDLPPPVFSPIINVTAQTNADPEQIADVAIEKMRGEYPSFNGETKRMFSDSGRNN
jgi:TP901 family phage tail tape measure protein